MAIIGAGMSGLVNARYLLEAGYQVQIFESHSRLGGQWATENPRSGIWAAMRTNTPNFLTKFTDADFPAGTPLFPHNQQVWAMLNDLAERFNLKNLIRFGAEVTNVEDVGDNYQIAWLENGTEHCAIYDRVVIATGRFNQPEIPEIPGWQSFPGQVIHSFDYQGVSPLFGKRVCVLGSNTSAMEITSDLAMSNQVEVVISRRLQRYVTPKVVLGKPIELLNARLVDLIAAEELPERELIAKVKDFIEQNVGSPEVYGLPAPDRDFSKAGITSSPYFLNLAAEGRLIAKPKIERIAGATIYFADNSSAEFDAIIFCTGYKLNLPFRNYELTELKNFTLPAAEPKLAYVGFWNLTGAYPVAIEQQARYLAYLWSGAISSNSTMGTGNGFQIGNHLAYRFAQLAGVTPDLKAHPDLAPLLLQLPPTGAIFKIDGPGSSEKYLDPKSWLAIN